MFVIYTSGSVHVVHAHEVGVVKSILLIAKDTQTHTCIQVVEGVKVLESCCICAMCWSL